VPGVLEVCHQIENFLNRMWAARGGDNRSGQGGTFQAHHLSGKALN
jgi:hypothetical protein